MSRDTVWDIDKLPLSNQRSICSVDDFRNIGEKFRNVLRLIF